MATRRVPPSQAATGADTFSDSLVGFQITDGTSQFTNTNFTIDRSAPERDTRTFSTGQFSAFLTLDDLKEEKFNSDGQTTETKKKEVSFRTSKGNANKSLFGSLKNRIEPVNVLKEVQLQWCGPSHRPLLKNLNEIDSLIKTKHPIPQEELGQEHHLFR